MELFSMDLSTEAPDDCKLGIHFINIIKIWRGSNKGDLVRK